MTRPTQARDIRDVRSLWVDSEVRVFDLCLKRVRVDDPILGTTMTPASVSAEAGAFLRPHSLSRLPDREPVHPWAVIPCRKPHRRGTMTRAESPHPE